MIDWLVAHWWQVWLYGGLGLYPTVLILASIIAPASELPQDGEDVFWTMCAVAFGCFIWPLAAALIVLAAPLSGIYGLGYWMLTFKKRRSERAVTVRAS